MNIFNSDDLPKPTSILKTTADTVSTSYEQKAKTTYDAIMAQVIYVIILGKNLLGNGEAFQFVLSFYSV